jgi:hypothetical protein
LLFVHLWSHCNSSDSNIGSLWGCLTRFVLLLLLFDQVARLWCFPWCRARIVNIVVEGCVGCGRCYLVSSRCRFYIIESCRRPWKCGRSWNSNTCSMCTANMRTCVRTRKIRFMKRKRNQITVQRFKLVTHRSWLAELAMTLSFAVDCKCASWFENKRIAIDWFWKMQFRAAGFGQRLWEMNSNGNNCMAPLHVARKISVSKLALRT